MAGRVPGANMLSRASCVVAALLASSSALADSALSTIAGTASFGFSGDGGPSTAAELDTPFGLVAGPDGTIYFSDSANYRVRDQSERHHHDDRGDR
jgi:hypothetical protein